ncbi:Uncharacterised protein [uncultured Clostridium sp.]|uniref:hypothetical protein n=1 Tax=uncultured Clostridium sp. TaxID=59620 RepID=UPI0008229AEE|nr:hypothetical protein [uncultured Clostridium sp.]SCJ51768.1 Uncharacterised protein [uncultured Clostridium sp.]
MDENNIRNELNELYEDIKAYIEANFNNESITIECNKEDKDIKFKHNGNTYNVTVTFNEKNGILLGKEINIFNEAKDKIMPQCYCIIPYNKDEKLKFYKLDEKCFAKDISEKHTCNNVMDQLFRLIDNK